MQIIFIYKSYFTKIQNIANANNFNMIKRPCHDLLYSLSFKGKFLNLFYGFKQIFQFNNGGFGADGSGQTTLAPFFKKIAKNTSVKAFVEGITAAVIGALVGSVIVIGMRSITDTRTALIGLAAALALLY